MDAVDDRKHPWRGDELVGEPARTGPGPKGGHDPGLVVVPAGDEVRTQLRRCLKIGMAQQVHADDPADVLVVDFDEAHERRDAEEQDDRQDEQRKGDEALSERGGLCTRPAR